jgi:Cu(I)/Ag(I) efflux system membrane fusion protein
MNKYLKYSLVVVVFSIIGITTYYFVAKSGNNTIFSNDEVTYTCPMPEDSVFSDQPGTCHKCGMKLIKVEKDPQQKVVYTCSMHPEVIGDAPGSCSICGMDLVRKVSQNQPEESNSIEHLLQPTDNFVVGNYTTTMPKDTTLTSEINLPGIVEYDPNSSVNIAARISGRLEKMYVNYKFQKVVKGQKLFDLYSPELLTEQQNFIYLITNDSGNASIIKASKQKLLLYGMSNNQINSLAAAKKTHPVISIYSPTNGIVQGTEGMSNNAAGGMQKTNETTTSLSIKEGDYIKKAQVIFKLVNTDKVWGVFNVSQGNSSLVKLNQFIRITSELDKKDFVDAKVNFIETQFNPADKTNRIRVYLNNGKLRFPIGLRLQGVVKSNAVQGIWLNKQAIVSIGSKKVVFVKMDKGFKAKEIKTGIEIDGYAKIMEGISVQDKVVENGQYLMDSESFIKTE